MTFCQLLAFVLVRCGFKPGPILVIGILDVLVNLPKFILQQINDYFGKIKYPQEFFSLIFDTLKGCRLSAINCTYKVTFPTRELLRFSITRLTASCWTGSKYLISGLANVFSESFENFSDLRLKTLPKCASGPETNVKRTLHFKNTRLEENTSRMEIEKETRSTMPLCIRFSVYIHFVGVWLYGFPTDSSERKESTHALYRHWCLDVFRRPPFNMLHG